MQSSHFLVQSQSSKPFIIRGKKPDYLLAQDDPCFDPSVESKAIFVQACNWFISMILIYESVKQFYYVFYYEDICNDYSQMMIYYMSANAYWIVISVLGARFIRSKVPKKIMIFLVLLVLAMLSRIGIYFIMYNGMRNNISASNLENCMCQAIYVQGLYLIQAITEAIILLLIIIFNIIIYKYIKRNFIQYNHKNYDIKKHITV